jgi:alanyl-tRNA synthetase
MSFVSTKNHFIIADHIKATCFLVEAGVLPGPKQQGYVLRRLIRRSLSASLKLKIDISNPAYFQDLVNAAIEPYLTVYTELEASKSKIIEVLVAESQKYSKAISRGSQEWAKALPKINQLSFSILSKELAQKTWDLYQTHGVPIEVSLDFLEENQLSLDSQHLEFLISSHQKLSQTTSTGQFKSGLGDHTAETIRLHTATHLLHQTLREVLGQDVEQRGSAITAEKARFDFTCDFKIETDKLELISQKVQDLIDKKLKIEVAEMTPTEARNLGAIGLFGEKYGDKVTVYTILDDSNTVFSREFCTGPHVQNTSEIGRFHILKQESLGQGLRRLIYKLES